MTPSNMTPTHLNERVFRAVSALLVGLMMVCAVSTLLQFINQSFGGWRPLYLPVIVFLFSLERFYLHPTQKHRRDIEQRRILSLGAYWVAVLIILKLVTTLSHGWQALVAEIPFWQEDFLTSIFTLEYLAVLVICFLTWMISGVFVALLDEMGLDQALLARDHGVAISDSERTPRERLQGVVFTLGAFLVVLTALSRLDVRAILSFQEGHHITALPWLAGGGLSTLLYFMLGFALLSLTKFINLNIRWRLQGIPVSPNMSSRWAGYSVMFLAILAIMVSLLPTHYSMGLISILHRLLSLLIAFVVFISGVFWTLLMLPIMALLSLFGRSPSEGLATPAPPPITPAIPDPAIDMSIPGWEIIKPYLFWGLFLVVVVYALRYYLLQHEELLRSVQRSPLKLWLQQLRHWIAGLFRNVTQQFSALMEEGVERLRSVGMRPSISRQGRFLSLGRLSPRQQIRFYYFALIRRGNENHLPREESQTPTEYAVKLEKNLPDMISEIDIMTRLFIRVRYTQQDIDKEDVKLMRRQWEKIRNVFRHRRESME